MKQLGDFDLSNKAHRYLARKIGFNVPKMKRGGGLKSVFDFVDKLPSGCWEFTGWRDDYGYGRHCVGGGKSTGSHRAAWVEALGPIPEGIKVLHSCDNPPCCNPDHLFLGTQADNVKDKVNKGRQAKGESAAKVKLTQSQAIELKAMRGLITGVEASKRYGITPSAVCAIWKGRSWKHI